MTVPLTGLNHVGVRVRDFARSVEWYGRLGFRLVWHSDAHAVACLRHDGIGIELNLILNADGTNAEKNVLMDVPAKHPGFNHLSFRVASIEETVQRLAACGIPIKEGPVRLGGEVAVFVRDPDSNVIELAEITSSST